MKLYEKIAIWAITPGGGKLGLDLVDKLDNADFYIPEWLAISLKIENRSKLGSNADLFVFKSLSKKIIEKFTGYSAHVFIFSTGIAVRLIVPLLQSKLRDPAVVVLDEMAFHAISLISGHMGNANKLAGNIAELTEADPVITTATDLNCLPAIDMIAKHQNLIIENPAMIKKINMAFLKNQKINLMDPYGFVYPHVPDNFLTQNIKYTRKIKEKENKKERSKNSYPSILCSDKIIQVSRETLILRPLSLTVGIGCNRNTCADEIDSFLKKIFNDFLFSVKSIKLLASADIKQDERGLLELADKMNLKISFYNKKELNSITNIKNPSAMVEKHIGVKSVCEAAAILASNSGELIVPKMKKGNVTLAVARKPQNYL